jgi:hypothetical protein
MSRIGVFVSRQWPDLASLVANDDEIKRCRDVLGLDLAFIGAIPGAASTPLPNVEFARSTEASTVRQPPPAIQSQNPFADGVRDRLGPGVRFTEDDTMLRRAIDAFHRNGIKCWMVTLAWAASGATLFPDGMAVDLRGKRADELGSSMFCPSNTRVAGWFASYLPYLLREYGADGVFFTHSRYPPTIDMLWACACPSCGALASELGFDFEKMRAGMLAFRRQLSELAPRSVRALATMNLGMLDLMQDLEPASGVRDWWAFRAAVLSRALSNIGAAVHAASSDATFAVQSLFPSLATVLGHPLGSWPSQVDQVVFMMSYIREVALRFVVAGAEFVTAMNPQVQQGEALGLACRVAGWPDISEHMPASLSELKAKIATRDIEWSPWYERLLRDEIAKGILLTKSAGAMVGLRGNTWPKEVADRLRENALSQGATGVVYQSYTLPWS